MNKTMRQTINGYYLAWALLIIVFLGGSGCSRENRFLYKKKDPIYSEIQGQAPSTTVVPGSQPSPWPSVAVPPILTEEKSVHMQFAQTETQSSPIDVLWVIDNSGSMSEEQQHVINNTEIFMKQFAVGPNQLDWKMGMISTDESEPPYIGFAPGDELDSKSVDPVGRFKAAVSRLGIDGSYDEMSMTPLLKTAQNYPAFFRKKALLAILLVSDEDDSSPITPAVWATQFAAFKPLKDIQLHGILGVSEDGCATGNNYLGSAYEAFMMLLKGTRYSLCSDFGVTLAQIGAAIQVAVAEKVIRLPERAIPSSIKVFYRGVEIPGGPAELGGSWRYNYDANMVVFHDTSFVDVSDLFLDVTYLVRK